MKIKYKCRCDANERNVDVPDRVAGSDLERWMNCVYACLGYDHTARSPYCQHEKTEYIKIPMPDGTEELGKPVVKQ